MKPDLPKLLRPIESRDRDSLDAPDGTIKDCDICGIAETLGNLVARLDLEVNGAKGREETKCASRYSG